MNTPSKIVCIGRNYAAHIQELGNTPSEDMVVFIKPASSLSDRVFCEHQGEVLHYETELCFRVVGDQLQKVALGLDLTKRDTQNKLKSQGLPWEKAKAFAHSAVMGEFVDFKHLNALTLELWIDGEKKQAGGVKDMLFKPEQILQEVKTWLPLEDGDILMTGTPQGVGPLKRDMQLKAVLKQGDKVLAEENWTVK